jgi:hypothetical protein
MNKRILFFVIGIILLLIGIFYLIVSEGELREIGIIYPIALILSIVSFIFSYRYKKRESLSAPLASQSADNIPIIDTMATNNTQVIIPETCPHCKNPNTKRIRLCEWCGNQIV